MRVLAVTNMYPAPHAPGSGTFVEQQIKGLRDIGLNVAVLYLDRKQKGIRVYFNIPKLLRSEIKSFEPHLIHIMYGGVMADEVTRAVKDRPTVVTFHGSDLLGENYSGLFRKLIAGYGVRASRRAARRAHKVITVSKTLREVLLGDIEQSKVHVIPNGIDLERFKPLNRELCRERLKWSADKFHILFPANSGDPVKRPELAEAAAASLRRRGVVVEIHYLQGVINEDVPVWLNASNVLLVTSFHEGSPTIVKEALACDLPIVSVDVGDVTQRIRDIEGCHIALTDQDDLAGKLLLVRAGAQKVKGRDRMTEFSLQRIARQVASVYSEALTI